MEQGKFAVYKVTHTLKNPVGAIYVLSDAASFSVEEIGKEVPQAQKWIQTRITRNRDIVGDYIKRAEMSGFSAIVLTVDQPFQGRLKASKSRLTLLETAKADVGKNFRKYLPPEYNGNLPKFVVDQFDPNATWEDIKWIKSVTKLPIILKGILRPVH